MRGQPPDDHDVVSSQLFESDSNGSITPPSTPQATEPGSPVFDSSSVPTSCGDHTHGTGLHGSTFDTLIDTEEINEKSNPPCLGPRKSANKTIVPGPHWVYNRTRMRIHVACHICSTRFGRRGHCPECRHRRCPKCPKTLPHGVQALIDQTKREMLAQADELGISDAHRKQLKQTLPTQSPEVTRFEKCKPYGSRVRKHFHATMARLSSQSRDSSWPYIYNPSAFGVGYQQPYDTGFGHVVPNYSGTIRHNAFLKPELVSDLQFPYRSF